MQTARDPFDGPVIVFGLLAGLTPAILATAGSYLYRWVFTSTFLITLAFSSTVAWVLILFIDKQWSFQRPSTDWNPQLMIALLLVFELILVLSSAASAASIRLGRISTPLVVRGSVSGGFDRSRGAPTHR